MNTQHVEGIVAGSLLDVVDIWKTIQGEGPYVGTPAVFVRLAGCNLQCPGCDTNYTVRRHPLTVEAVRDQVLLMAGSARLVVLTGGEPLRQMAVADLLNAFPPDWEVQVETNGTVCPIKIPYFVKVVCSPKTTKIHDKVWEALWANGSLKYVVEPVGTDPEDGLPLVVLGKDCRVARPEESFPREDIFIQPMDSHDVLDNRLAMSEAVKVCMKFGYRLCLQVHKIVGLA